MRGSELPSWSEITREERFFTCILFQDLLDDPTPLMRLLQAKLQLPANTEVDDVGFELCFFRDGALAGLVSRRRDLEKQTFDLVLTLSGKRMVIIEAKAQQGMTNKQMAMLHAARELMYSDNLFPFRQVDLAAIWSSRYSPRGATRERFDAFFIWQEIATIYPGNRKIYERADSLYSDRAHPQR